MTMKLTESRLRNIIREELSRLSEAGGRSAMGQPAVEGSMPKVAQNIHKYLANVGMSVGPDMYEYKGLYFHIDKMGGMATFVNVFRHRDDSESIANATVEDNGMVKLETGTSGPGGFPRSSTVEYRSPKQVIESLVERADGGQTAYR